MAESLLTAYWVKGQRGSSPSGFGVTARNVDDALRIIRGWGHEMPANISLLDIREDVTIDELDHHVVCNMGPIVVRGMWYPFCGLGVPAWMDV